MNENFIQQFKKGTLEMILLALIARGETYGYELLSELNQRGAQVLGYAKEGTIYPILYRLQDGGLISCRVSPAAANGSSRKYYSLTPKGQDVLREMLDFWPRYTECVNDFIEGGQS